MTKITFISETVEQNGKTIKQNNLEKKKHNIELGTLVEITSDDTLHDEEDQHNGLRLFVVQHTRDCDGTPLYSLSFNKAAGCELQSAMDDLEKQAKGSLEHDLVSWMTINLQGSILHGFPEESLKVV